MGTRRGELSGMGGTINVAVIIPATTAFNVAVANPTMIIDDHIYDEALSYYVASECLDSEGEDTFNQQRQAAFKQEYIKQLMGG